MSIDLLIALIPALPLAGFLFAVIVGPRLDQVPVHGHHGHEGHDDHAAHDAHDDHAPRRRLGLPRHPDRGGAGRHEPARRSRRRPRQRRRAPAGSSRPT